jgi:hypothetical protein
VGEGADLRKWEVVGMLPRSRGSYKAVQESNGSVGGTTMDGKAPAPWKGGVQPHGRREQGRPVEEGRGERCWSATSHRDEWV